MNEGEATLSGPCTLHGCPQCLWGHRQNSLFPLWLEQIKATSRWHLYKPMCESTCVSSTPTIQRRPSSFIVKAKVLPADLPGPRQRPGISLASLHLALSPSVNSAPTTAASSLFLQHVRYNSTLGPLHLLFYLECSFPKYANGSSLDTSLRGFV